MGWYNVANASAATGSSTFVFNYLAGTGSPQLPAIGDLVVVLIGASNAAAFPVVSVTDSQSQTYSAAGVTAGSGNQRCLLYTLVNGKTVTGSDSITITFTGSSGGKFAVVKGLDGASSATVDKSSTGAATSLAPSSGATAALAQAAEAVIGGFQWNAASPSTFSGPSFGSLLQVTNSAALGEIDELVNSTASVTASGTFSGTAPVWSALVATFELTAPSITTASPLPGGTTGAGYSQTIAESGGTSTFTWAKTAGSLTSSGLSFSSGGVLSGTCQLAGTYTFTAQVTDGAGQTASKSFSVTITNNLGFTTSSPLPAGTQGSGYSQTIGTSGGFGSDTHAVTGGSLTGSGLSLSSAGVLSGTAGTPATYTFTDTVTDAAGNTASKSYSVTINAAAAVPMFPLPVKVELELLAGVWTDITSYVYIRDGIQIQGGRPDESSTAQPAQLTLTLNNTGGDFTPNYAGGAFYPNLQRNIQIRVSVVNATSSSGNTYSGYRFWGSVADWPPQSDVTGQDIYVQITANGPLRQLTQGGGKGSALTRYYGSLTGTQEGFSLAPVAYWPCEEDPDNTGTIGSGIGFDPSSGAGQSMTVTGGTPGWKTITFSGSTPVPIINKTTWDGKTGSFGVSGDDVYNQNGTYLWTAPTGITSVTVKVFGAGGGGANGSVGAGGSGGGYQTGTTVAVTPGHQYTVVVGAGGQGGNAAPNFNGQAGQAGGNSSFTGDSVTITGFGGNGGPNTTGSSAAGVSGSGGTGHTSGAGGAGVSNNLGGAGGGSSAGTSGNGNAGHNGSTGSSGQPGGAAPAGGAAGGAGGNEGGGGAGQTGQSPGGAGGGGGFYKPTNFCHAGGPGADGQVEIIYSASGVTPPVNVDRFVLHVPAYGGNNNAELIRFYSAGSGTNAIAQLRVLYGTGGKLKLQGWNATPSLLFDTGFTSFNADGTTLLMSCELTQSGTSVNYALSGIIPGATSTVARATGTQPSSTLGSVTECTVDINGNVTNTSVSHISVQYAYQDIRTVSRALNGHDTEAGVDRLIRLGNEQAMSNIAHYNETVDHWGFETGTNSWTGTNCTVTQSGTTINPGLSTAAAFTTWPPEGTHSLLLTANGAGQPSAISPHGTSGLNVTPGDTVAAHCEVYTPAAHSNLFIGLVWYNSGGTLLSENDCPDTATDAGQMTTLAVSAVAPANSAFFGVKVGNHNTDANGTLLYVDNVRVIPEMGVQLRKEYTELLQEIEDADQGILREEKAQWGLGYRTRFTLINQTAALTLHYDLNDVSLPFAPVYDDQKIKNDITVQRHAGSRVRTTLDTGQMSTQEPPLGAGRRRKTIKVSVNNDAQLAALVFHLLNLGTVVHERYPTITVDLTRAALPGTNIATQMSAVAAVDIGDFVEVTGLPFWFPSSTTKQLVLGYSEILGCDSGGNWAWTITWNCTPEDPYEIQVTSTRRW